MSNAAATSHVGMSRRSRTGAAGRTSGFAVDDERRLWEVGEPRATREEPGWFRADSIRYAPSAMKPPPRRSHRSFISAETAPQPARPSPRSVAALFLGALVIRAVHLWQIAG